MFQTGCGNLRSQLHLFAAMMMANTTAAQPPSVDSADVRNESPALRKRLSEAEKLLLAGKTAEARNSLTRIIDETSDDLIHIGGGQYRCARSIAQKILSRLPAEELRIYRQHVDAPAQKLLDSGRLYRDARPLLELVDHYACSTPACEAFRLLGELAFERGDFESAELYWMRLIQETNEGDRYPGPVPDAATIRARRILAVLFQGDPERAGKLFAEFQNVHSDAVGRLAGRQGNLVEMLRGEFEKPIPKFNLLGANVDWRTIGGDMERRGHAAGNAKLLPLMPSWTVPLPGKLEAVLAAQNVRRLSIHPVLESKQIFFTDGHNLYRVDRATGQTSALTPTTGTPSSQDCDFGLTLNRGRLYVRLGGTHVIPAAAQDNDSSSRLACFRSDGSKIWSRTPPVATGVQASWEGAPIVVDSTVLAVFSRIEGGRMVHAIACYDDRQEMPLWITDVCEIGSLNETRRRHELLTLAEQNVVYASHSGVIAAVNVRTGKPAWSHRYPRISISTTARRHRDLSPPISKGGRVFVAPNDSDRLFAFDARTGQLLWQSDPIQIDHLIGAVGPRIIAAIAGPNRGLRAYHTITGACEGPFGWMNHDDPMLATYGRGVIIGDQIAWPTTAGLYFIDVASGLPTRPLLRDVCGNIAYADGCMVVASTRTLWCFQGSSTPAESSTPSPIVVSACDPVEKVLPARLGSPPTVEEMKTWPRDQVEHSIVLLDEHRITGRNPDWFLDSSRRRTAHDFSIRSAPRFDPQIFVGEFSVARLTNDRCWAIDRKGHIVADIPCQSGPWQSPPVIMNDSLALPTEAGAIALVTLPSLRPIWQFRVKNPSGLSGEAPQLRAADGFLDVLFHRNHGSELVRIDSNGLVVWTSPAFVEGPLRLSNAASTQERLYLPLSGRVVALRSDTGREVWTTPMPMGRWSLHLLANTLVAVQRLSPSCEIRFEDLVQVRFGNVLSSISTEDGFSGLLVLMDPQTGRIDHRIAVRGPVTDVRVRSDGLWLSTPRNIYRVK